MRHLTTSGRQNLYAALVMVVITALTIIARLGIRFSRRQMPNGADYLCFLSAGLFYAYCAIIIHFILNSSLEGSFDVELNRGPLELITILKVTYAAEILFGTIITTVKLSILWFYHTVFSVGNAIFNRVIVVAAAVCAVVFIISTCLVIFQCRPISQYWNGFALPPDCLPSGRFLLGYELTNLFVDIGILCIPIPVVWKLNLKSSKRLGVLAIFFLGGLVCIASMVRLAAIWNPHNVAAVAQYSETMMWSTLQLGLAIICSCLPLLGPLLPIISKPFVSIGSWGASLLFRSNYRSEGHIISDEVQDVDSLPLTSISAKPHARGG